MYVCQSICSHLKKIMYLNNKNCEHISTETNNMKFKFSYYLWYLVGIAVAFTVYIIQTTSRKKLKNTTTI
jgi:hypothetical protein